MSVFHSLRFIINIPIEKQQIIILNRIVREIYETQKSSK